MNDYQTAIVPVPINKKKSSKKLSLAVVCMDKNMINTRFLEGVTGTLSCFISTIVFLIEFFHPV